jgi:hypothetical protein
VLPSGRDIGTRESYPSCSTFSSFDKDKTDIFDNAQDAIRVERKHTALHGGDIMDRVGVRYQK